MLKYISLLVVFGAVGIYFVVNQFSPKVKTPNELNPQYDYIIIGGGSAGCVLANRLSENPDISVLVLEAGGEENELFYSHIPGAVAFLQKSFMDWQYYTVPQEKCCDGLNDNQGVFPRGKVLGGTSILNYMNYVRASPFDFDHWAEMGNNGWSYKDVLPYFKKSENVLIERLQTSKYHGVGGPLKVTDNEPTVLGRAFVEAMRHLGYPLVDDYNGANQEGFGLIQFAIANGIRMSTSRTFLRPVMHRKNLHVVTKAHVARIVFDFNDDEKKATGVEYLYKSTKHRVLANKEIILSAGSIESPKILMLSGIGPKEQLEKFPTINTIQYLPAVGKQLKDHIGLHCRFSANESVGLDIEALSTIPGLMKTAFDYFVRGTGPLAVAPLDYTGFLKSRFTDSKVPEFQLYICPGDAFVDDFPKLNNWKDNVIQSLQVKADNRFPFAMFALILHPRSVGEITLQSTDPEVPPLIDPKYFDQDIDLDLLVEGTKIIESVLDTPQMKRYDAKRLEGSIPQCEKFEMWSEDYVRCLARSRSITCHHPIGTCRMGTSPENSVVDAELRVHGVNRLRVVDGSVFPDQISGNTYATVLMIAEKAADLIKKSA